MTIAQTKKAFMKAVRDNVKAKAKAKGVQLTKEELEEITIQQVCDAMAGDSKRVLDDRLDDLLDMA